MTITELFDLHPISPKSVSELMRLLREAFPLLPDVGMEVVMSKHEEFSNRWGSQLFEGDQNAIEDLLHRNFMEMSATRIFRFFGFSSSKECLTIGSYYSNSVFIPTILMKSGNNFYVFSTYENFKG